MILCSVDQCRNRVDFRFPSDPDKKNKWLKAIRRPKYIPKKHHGLCRRHFVKEQIVVESRAGGFKNTRRILFRDAVPCVFAWNVPESPKCEIEETDLEMKPIKQESEDIDAALEDPEFEPIMDIKTEDCGVTADDPITVKIESSCQYDLSGSVQSCAKMSAVSTQTPRTLGIFTIEDLRQRPDFISYYTGLESYDKFMNVLHSLGREAYSIKYRNSHVLSVNVPDQLLITLWKLRRNCTDFELGINFGVSKATISNIVHSWIKFMAQSWSKIDIWPSKEMVEYYIPPTLCTKYLSSKKTVDETIHAKNPQAQQGTFRTCGKRKTSKVLIRAAPGGMTSFCSLADGTSTSDQQITEQNSLPAKCVHADSAMEDKGSNVQDISTSEDVKIGRIPTFVKGRDSLPTEAPLNDDKLAERRIHMDKIIRLAKTYKIWNTKLNHHLAPLATEIFSLIIILCNFRKGVVRQVD